MWTPLGLGHGRRMIVAGGDSPQPWTLELRVCPDQRAAVLTIAAASADGIADAQRCLTLRLQTGSGQPLPEVAESYVRGDDFVVVMPQTDAARFGLTLQTRLVEADRRRAIAEILIAIQTDLLDCHPIIELSSPPGTLVDGHSPRPVAEATQGDERPGRVARLQLPATAGGHAALLFGSGDGPVQEESAGQQEASFHLFGEFMERGVIRKTHPWVVLWRGEAPSDQELAELLRQRQASPLPLTT